MKKINKNRKLDNGFGHCGGRWHFLYEIINDLG